MSQDLFVEVVCGMYYEDVLVFYVVVGEGYVFMQFVLEKVIVFVVVDDLIIGFIDLLGSVQMCEFCLGDFGVFVCGVNDIFVKFVKCCMFVLGDFIVGFVMCGSGVFVYCLDCVNVKVLSVEEDCFVEVLWVLMKKSVFWVQIQVEVFDCFGLLFDVIRVLSEYYVNIFLVMVIMMDECFVLSCFVFEMGDVVYLDCVLNVV